MVEGKKPTPKEETGSLSPVVQILFVMTAKYMEIMLLQSKGLSDFSVVFVPYSMQEFDESHLLGQWQISVSQRTELMS